MRDQPSILLLSSTTSSLRISLSSDHPVSIPVLNELIPDGVKPETLFLVEFDPESRWLALAVTIEIVIIFSEVLGLQYDRNCAFDD